MKLTEQRIRILQAAAKHELGLVERPYMTGYSRVAWDKNAKYLVDNGLLTPYVHGGFEITDLGREAVVTYGSV